MNADNWRAECAKYRGVGPRDQVDPAVVALRMSWVTADLAPKVKTPKDKSRTIPLLGPDAKNFTFTANGESEVNTLADELFEPSGKYRDFGPVTAKCLQRRYTQRGTVYVWQTVPGGRFDRFETVGLPDDIQEVKKK